MPGFGMFFTTLTSGIENAAAVDADKAESG
jgi:hypothetical protein